MPCWPNAFLHMNLTRRGDDLKSVDRSSLLSDYMTQIACTDRLRFDHLQPILLGLCGEVESIMAIAKKFHREEAHAGVFRAVKTNLGGTILCDRTARTVEYKALEGEKG